VRVGARGATYLTYRKAIQEAVAAQLAAWGDLPDAGEGARHRISRPVERDLQAILGNLADTFPLLSSLVERHAGGQRRLPMAGAGREIAEALKSVHGEAPQAEESEARNRSPEIPGEGPVPRRRPPPRATPGSRPCQRRLPRLGRSGVTSREAATGCTSSSSRVRTTRSSRA
jgi:hypothetical protein